MNSGDISALVQQLLLFHGGRYLSRADEENWKSVAVTLQVPPQPIDRLQLPAGQWLVAPWHLPGGEPLRVWLTRLQQAGERPQVIVLASDTLTLPPEELQRIAQEFRIDIAQLAANPLAVAGTEPARLAGHAFEADMQRSMRACNPLDYLAGHGDPRDPAVFAERLRRTSPNRPVTSALLAANVLVYLAMLFAAAAKPGSGGLWRALAAGFQTDQLIAWGASSSDRMAAEPWRLLTSAFLHGNFLHILMNMLALRQLGALAEPLLGSPAFAAAYLLSALGGAVGSFDWRALTEGASVSVGASGAVFGVLGATLGFALARRDALPRGVYRSILSSGGFFVLINGALGVASPVIDNAAHLGGLVCGVAAGALLSRELPPARQPRRPLQLAATAAVAAFLVLLFRLGLGLQAA